MSFKDIPSSSLKDENVTVFSALHKTGKLLAADLSNRHMAAITVQSAYAKQEAVLKTNMQIFSILLFNHPVVYFVTTNKVFL